MRKIHEFLLALRASQITVQLREHAQIPTRPVRLLAAIRANSLTLRQSARWQQLASPRDGISAEFYVVALLLDALRIAISGAMIPQDYRVQPLHLMI